MAKKKFFSKLRRSFDEGAKERQAAASNAESVTSNQVEDESVPVPEPEPEPNNENTPLIATVSACLIKTP